jgi:hypothetical protein
MSIKKSSCIRDVDELSERKSSGLTYVAQESDLLTDGQI